MQPSPARPLVAFLDRFLSPGLREAPAHELRRGRVLVGGSLLMQVLLGLITIDGFRQGLPSAWTSLVGIGVWAALLPLLRRGHDRLAGLWISSYAQLAMLFVVLHRDSTFELYDPWQGVLIMMALFLFGARFGALALGVVVAEAIVIPILGSHGLLLESPLLFDRGSSGPESIAAFFAIFALGWLYTAARDDANRELQATLRTLSQSREEYQLIAEGTDAVPFTFDLNERQFRYVGPHVARVFQWRPEEWLVPGFVERVLPDDDASRLRNALAKARPGEKLQLECSARTASGQALTLRLIGTLRAEFGTRTLVGLMLDITELRHLELSQAQKLESVGRLAAGIAHEINTPVQFVSDSVHFLRESSQDLLALLRKLRSIRRAPLQGAPLEDALAQAEAAEEEADLPYLLEHMPLAFERATGGLKRVATIVRSMREFAHPDAQEKSSTDLNRAIENTLNVSTHEYRAIADVVTDFGTLPPVRCLAGEINQAILNIIVNASHAIGDVVKKTGERGRIVIKTRHEGDDVVVSIADTGGGIPLAIRERIFDPFFTTKEVGRGTGQGLAVARNVIVDKHKGELSFLTEVGKGTTFLIRLPVGG